MANAKVLIALTALLGFSLPSPAEIIKHLYDFAVAGSGYPNDQINDHAAFMAAQVFFQEHYDYDLLGDEEPATLILEDGEYIIGKQQLHEYGTPLPPGWTTSIYPFNDDYPHCLPLVAWQNGFTLLRANDFTIQGGTNTSIRYRDCLYYGTFFRTPGTNEVFSATQQECLACNQAGHPEGLLHAQVGSMFTFRDCDNITIRDLELNGNIDNALLGGRSYFDGIQTPYDGIVFDYTSNSLIESVNAHHFGKDGLIIMGHEDFVPNNSGLFPDPADSWMPPASQTILFQNTVQQSQFNWNGRQGISWTACAGLTLNYCDMNYNAAGRVSSSLRAGLDIEGRGGPYRVRYGVFNHCNFLHNRFWSIHANTGPCLGQQDFRFNYCIVKAGTEGLAILPNSRGMKFDHCEIYGNVGPFFEQAENLPWDPEFDVHFTHTTFSEEDEQWRYIKWFPPNECDDCCKAGPHMFQFTPDRAGPVRFDTCTFNTNCHAIVRLAGLDAVNKENLPWCTPCPQGTCVTPGPCLANCGVDDARYVKINDCTFRNRGRNDCDETAETQVIGVDLATTGGAFGIRLEIPGAVKDGEPGDIYSADFGENGWGAPDCLLDPPYYCNDIDPITTNDPYPICRPLFDLPDRLLHCGPENLPLQACVSDADCEANLIITDGTLSSTLASPVAGTVYIQAQFIVDQDFTFDGAEVKMGPGAEIIVQPDIQLFVFNTTIESCLGMMWKSITANDLAVIFMVNSRIADSESGLTGLDGSILYMDQTEFANNRLAVTVPEQGQYNSVGIYAVNSTFHSEGPIVQPYPGQTSVVGEHGYAALDVNDMTLYFTGGNNVIHHLSNGIIAHRSDVKVSSCIMHDIQPAAAYDDELVGNGSGIYARGTQGVYGLTQVGYGTSGTPSFEDCRWGIYTEYMNVYSWDNNMVDVGTAYRVDRSENKDVLIRDNSLDTRFDAIVLNMNDGANSLLVENNAIVFASEPPLGQYVKGYVAIRVNEANTLNVNSVIKNNVINYRLGTTTAYAGIHLTSARKYLVANNEMNMTDNATNYSGVFLRGCKQVEVSCNTVNGANNGYLHLGQAGIRNWMGVEPLISCNTVDQTTNGILFSGYALDVDLKGNEFNQHRWGLHLEFGAQIGTQDLKGNLWLQPAPVGDYQAWHENEADALTHSILADLAVANIFPPSREPGFWFQQTSGPTYECSPDVSYCEQFGPRCEGCPKEIYESIANGTLQNGEFTDETLWTMGGDLYQILKNSPDLLEVSLFEDFYENTQSTVAGQLKDLEDERLELFELDASVLAQLQQNRAQLQLLQTELESALEQLASPGFTATQLTALQGTIAGLQQTMNDLLAYNTTALDLAATSRVLGAESIKNTNAAIGATELTETNYKTVNAIYLSTVAKYVDTFTAQQSQDLFEVADQCPLLGGNAVFQARALYYLIDPNQDFDDPTLCLQHGLVTKSLKQDAAIAVSIVPNPASDEATLVLTEPLQGSGLATFCNSTGAEVFNLRLSKEQQLVDFSTARLAPGIYHYRVVSSGVLLGTGDLSIMR